ncbi:MAG: energy transducer TonB [Gammaproteobacteria bacterium]|nr:energy transducer TonB [Gammaproteobacteria bacterium]
MSTHTTHTITASDRLGMTLFLAISFHVLLILGVSFDIEDDQIQHKQPLPTMEITLVHSEDDKEPDDADFLAQANQRGGGNEKQASRPGSPHYNPLPIPDQGEHQRSQMQTAPEQFQQPKESPVMIVRQAQWDWQKAEPSQVQTPLPKDLVADSIHERQLELASISAEIQRLQKMQAQTPNEKYISANTREYKYASYFDAWRSKVERIGNLNYPDEAKRGHISGELLLDVAINADGSLQGVHVLRSSGHQVLDDAAKRIVKMAAPYAAFSEDIRKDFPVLHITYTWRFDSMGLSHTIR